MIDIDIALSPGGRVPTSGSKGAAGCDIYSTMNIMIAPGETRRVSTGIHTQIPAGYEAQIRGRSGLAMKGMMVALGTIDCDYRGEWGIIFHNSTKELYQINIGDRIAQAVFNEVPRINFNVVQDLDKTNRGINGFGSTGRGE